MQHLQPRPVLTTQRLRRGSSPAGRVRANAASRGIGLQRVRTADPKREQARGCLQVRQQIDRHLVENTGHRPTPVVYLLL